MLQMEMNGLYRDKYLIKEELNKCQAENGKLRIFIQKLQNDNSDLIHELKLQNKNAKVQIKHIEVIKEENENSESNQKLKQYKDIIK